MQMDQWKTASAQLLKHWSRSGITQLPAGTSESIAAARSWLEKHSNAIIDNSDTYEPISDERESGVQIATTKVAITETAIGSHLISAKPSSLSLAPTAEPTLPSLPDAGPTKVESLSKGPAKWMLPVVDLQGRLDKFAALNQEVIACRKCDDIVCRRQQTVFGVGAINARVVMFGEAPGADEDRLGEPFVGAAGQLLDKILVASGLKRPEVYIVNALKCRPPNNRTPTEIEIENCRPYFETQLETIQPEYIVCWGAVAVRAVLGSKESVGRLRGKFHQFRGAKVMVTYHPAYLLRTPEAKKLTWEDMKMLMKDMGLPIPSKG